jgi:hypothetical protein
MINDNGDLVPTERELTQAKRNYTNGQTKTIIYLLTARTNISLFSPSQ